MFEKQPEVSAHPVLGDLTPHYFDVADADPELANIWKLIDDHAAKNGWTRLESDDLGMTSYFYDKRADIIYSIDAFLSRLSPTSLPQFDIVHGYTDRRLRKWNKLPVHDQYFPTTMFG